MRKLLSRYSLITTLLVGVGVFALPHFAHAGMTDWILNWSSIGADLIYGFISKIFWFGTIPLTAWVLWLVGLMIDGIITLSSTPSFYDAPAISASWGIIRDVCNMLFIFILIYEGIRTILNIGNMTSVKSTIAGVILAAVFINFSLFATKVVIDVSNITAAWFIQGVKNVGGTESVSDAVVASLQMKKLVQNNQYGRAAMTKESFVAGMALTVLNLVAIYVLFKVFFLLLGRLITFMFLLITAPIGFVGFLLPQLKGYAEKWWRELNAMAMMAPIFFLMLYITLFIIDQVDLFVFGGAGATDPVTGSSFAPANYIMFAIIIAMLLKVLEVTEEYSGEVAGKMGDLFKSAAGVALGGVAGAGAFMGRIGVRGAIAAYDKEGSLGDKIRAGAKTARDNAGGPIPLSLKSVAGIRGEIKDAMKKGTWDLRNAVPKAGEGAVKAAQSVASGKAGISFGAVDPKTRKETEKKWKEERGLQETEVSLLNDIKQLEKERADLEAAEKAHATGASAATTAALATAKAAVQKSEDKISATLYKTSNKDLEKLDKDGILTNENALNLMSSEEISHLLEKSELSESDKGKIRKVRQASLKKALDTRNASEAGKAIKKLGKKEIETLSSDILSHPNLDVLAAPEALDADKLDSILKSEAIVPGAKKKLRDARISGLKAITDPEVGKASTVLMSVLSDPSKELPATQAELRRYKEGEIAKMDKSVLQNPRVVLSLSPQTLGKILDNGELDSADRSVIRKIVEAAAGSKVPAGNSKQLAEWLEKDNRGKIF